MTILNCLPCVHKVQCHHQLDLGIDTVIFKSRSNEFVWKKFTQKKEQEMIKLLFVILYLYKRSRHKVASVTYNEERERQMKKHPNRNTTMFQTHSTMMEIN